MPIVALLMSAVAALFVHSENGARRDGPPPASAPAAPTQAHGAPAPGLAASVPAAVAALSMLGLVGATRLRRPKKRSDD
ncbi:hypothetical protein DJ018_17025 [Phenylobacterium deserti]|uniref:Uncharacterized protein n=1 Tax=Phenylobacterium deserti TaxID=1914756 RepID=A0A328A8R4_9CAUL|nr:hypothetical protein DJ018_17025 [Phenylobacterium deserti]